MPRDGETYHSDTVSRHAEGLARRGRVAVGIVLVLVLLGLWYAMEVGLLIFAGLLLALLLRGLSDWVSARTALASGWALAIVVVALVGMLGVSVWFLAPRVADQVDELWQQVPRAVQQVEERLARYAWGRQFLARMPNADALMWGRKTVLSNATGIFSTTLGAIASLVIVLVIGLYLATEPRLYVGGLIRLVPLAHRHRVREICGAVGTTLQWWLTGRMLLMAINGTLTTLGLWLLGVPLALTLGLCAALLNFIPNIGPIIAGVPAVLLALTQSPRQALYVVALYLVLQSVDGYLLTPLVDRRTVSVPPVLTLAAQMLLGVLLGGLGLALASPLTAAAIVLVQMLYIEDTLGDRGEVTGTSGEESLGRDVQAVKD